MKLLTPSIKDCRYIHRKLKQFYRESVDVDKDTTPDDTEFLRALIRFCNFYNLKIPKVIWYINLGNALGKCHENGNLELITPSNYPHGEYSWIHTTYHELDHCVLWSEAEEKAGLFADRMIEKWRK